MFMYTAMLSTIYRGKNYMKSGKPHNSYNVQLCRAWPDTAANMSLTDTHTVDILSDQLCLVQLIGTVYGGKLLPWKRWSMDWLYTSNKPYSVYYHPYLVASSGTFKQCITIGVPFS